MTPSQPHNPTPADPSPAEQHRAAATIVVGCGVVTVSDTRTAADDRGGATIVELLDASPHRIVAREIIPDVPVEIEQTITTLVDHAEVDAVLLTGGTGMAPRDHTIDVVELMLERTLPGYGELFRMLSFQQVGAAAMLSRATAGVIGQTVLFAMPGSPKAVRLAMEQLILPELGHLVSQIKGT